MSHDSADGKNCEAEALRRAEDEILKNYRKSIKGKDFVKLTMYQQLGIADLGFDATEEQIRKAYHRVLIEHHPDKTGKEENDPNYLAVQKALNTLIDPQKRRAYDSLCDFDESIPTGKETILQHSFPDVGGTGHDNGGVCFYTLYRPVFQRNARFSVNTPVPELGDESTPLESVYDFYDFWQKFDSWRDFSHDAEHDVDSAEHRDEKRWMMKKNEVVAKKKKKKEYGRLSNLLDRAMGADPRIRREKFQKKEAKRLAKVRKEEEEKRKEDEANAIIAEAEKKKQEEEEKRKANAKAAKYEREMAKKALRKAKKHFRALLEACRSMDVENVPDIVQTEDICDASDLETIKRLSDGLGSVDTIQVDGLQAVRDTLASLK